MSLAKETWITFAAFVAIALAGHTIRSAASYPQLPHHLRDTCKTANWHPECGKEDYSEQ